MIISLKKITSGLVFILLMAMMYAPVTFAQAATCDQDGDGFIAFPASGAEVILGEGFDPNGDYSALEWETFFNQFAQDPAAADLCNDALNFKEGAEPSRCDALIVEVSSGVYDPSKVDSVSGVKVNPGAFDSPDDGVDQDCDGEDGELVSDVSGGSVADLEGLADRVVSWLSRLVMFVSVIVLLWAGVMYAGAAGDEHKTRLAKKAAIGGVIGLVVGLLASTIVTSIVSLF